jgi:hypothetical protein
VSANVQAVRAYLDAATSGTAETRAALASHLAGDVMVRSPLGQGAGPDAVLEGVQSMGPLFTTGTWSEPVVDGDAGRVSASFPAGSALGGATLTFTFDRDGKVSALTQQLAPPPPPPAGPVKLDQQIATAIDGALDNGTPIIAAYVDAEGQAQLSFRGTTQVYSEDQLALWIRDPGGGMVRALAHNPRLTFWYRDPETRVFYQLQGVGHIETDPAARDVVFDHSPEREQVFDPDRNGVAIVVDLHRVTGRGPDGPVNMLRDA